MKNLFVNLIALSAVIAGVLAPASSFADTYSDRQKTKNEWRNLGTAAAAVGIYGLVKKDSTLTFAGAAGALYSAYRYEQDRKSQNRMNRFRYDTFRRGSFERDGRRYNRQTVYKNGKKYYCFKEDKNYKNYGQWRSAQAHRRNEERERERDRDRDRKRHQDNHGKGHGKGHGKH